MMSNNLLGVFIGGIIPALLLGGFGVLQKSSNAAGIGVGIYLTILGLMVTLCGAVLWIFIPGQTCNRTSVFYTCLTAMFWAGSTASIAIAISKFSASISKLVPIYNMNTLVAVLLGMILFSEYKHIDFRIVLIGATFIVIGGILVARA